MRTLTLSLGMLALLSRELSTLHDTLGTQLDPSDLTKKQTVEVAEIDRVQGGERESALLRLEHHSGLRATLFVDWQLNARTHLFGAAPRFQQRSKQETRPTSPEGKE